jgi:hypothetical protein
MAATTAILVFMGFSLIVTCQFPIARFRILFNLAHKGGVAASCRRPSF